MPSVPALIRAIARYDAMGYHLPVAILRDVLDAEAKPCGRGWVGTKPPGCKRAGKTGEGAAKPKSTRKTKAPKEAVPKEPKAPKEKKPRKRSQRAIDRALPEDHALTLNPRFQKDSLDKALDSIQTEGAAERIKQFRRFTDTQGIQVVMPDLTGDDAKEFEMVQQGLKYKSFATNDDRLKKSTSAVVGAKGFTNPNTRHVVVSTSSSGRESEPFAPDPRYLNGIVGAIARGGKMVPSLSHTALKSPDTMNMLTYIHEMGHQVHFAVGMIKPPKGVKSFTKYGGTKHEEWFAEHFAIWMLDAKSYAKVDPIGAKFIEDTMAKATKAPRRLG